MQNRKQFGLLVCMALMLLASQTLWGQFVVQVSGTDGSGITDTLTLAVDPAGTASFDSLSPSLREYEIPVAAKGLDFRVATNFPSDIIGLGSYTSIHYMAYAAQTDKWKMQFNVDSGRTSIDLQWPAGLGSVGGGVWKIIPDPDDAITFSDVDMTTSTSASIPVTDIEPHTFYIVTGDGQKYRSFSVTDLVGALDSKGKAGKSEKRKAYASQGTFTWTNILTAPETTVTDLYIEWSQNIDENSLSISPSSTHAWVDPVKPKKLNINFPGGIAHNQVVTIYAQGDKGKSLQAKKWYWKFGTLMYPPKVKNLPVDAPDGLLRYKMPNTNNIGEEAYSQIVFVGPTSEGLTIGDPVTAIVLDIKGKPVIRGVVHPKWKDVLKTLSDKTGMHTGAPTCLEFFLTTKPIVKKQKSLPPGKHSNRLLAEAVAMKVNIGAGDAGKVEEGGTAFGDLLYVRQVGDPMIPSGASVRAIAESLDNVMRCALSSWDSGGVHNYSAWYNAAHRINGSFSGPFDTLSFVAPIPPPHPKTSGTVATGVHAIMDVPYLYRTNFANNLPDFGAPNIKALESRNQPEEYRLMQNYPNPFNPTTTIEFALPEDAIVSISIFNVLGQEVAKLVDHELMDEGTNEVTFDATSLSSGVYYYRLVANQDMPGQFTKVMKMVLVK
jgi:hypothetical protein